jgi:hypothetical protein
MRRIAEVLSQLCKSRVAIWHRFHSGKPHLARQSRLGNKAGLLQRIPGPSHSQVDRPSGRNPERIRDVGCTDGYQRMYWPRGDGYNPCEKMSSTEAANYHSAQIGVFSNTDADMVTAITMNYVEEAIGIAQSAKSHGMPVAISFTVETDGRLPTGHSLAKRSEVLIMPRGRRRSTI